MGIGNVGYLLIASAAFASNMAAATRESLIGLKLLNSTIEASRQVAAGSLAEAVLALQRYGIHARAAEFKERVTLAAAWLQKATPNNTYQHALQLLALSAAGVGKDAVKKVADSLVARQRTDVVWAGNPNLGSDAHFTGVALHALRESAFLSASDMVHRRGVQYLLSTQYPDGSWHVRSRAAGFQPYFQSGFPFEHDQWISAAATGWAAEALARIIETPAAGPREAHAKEQPEGR